VFPEGSVACVFSGLRLIWDIKGDRHVSDFDSDRDSPLGPLHLNVHKRSFPASALVTLGLFSFQNRLSADTRALACTCVRAVAFGCVRLRSVAFHGMEIRLFSFAEKNASYARSCFTRGYV
jgi:hypothetical protein